MNKYWIAKIVLLGALIILALSVTLMLLWNWLVPRLFDGPAISLWQATGLLIMARLLLHLSGRSHWVSGHRRVWRKRFEKRWNCMTPEEQAQFKQKFAHRCRNWRWEEPEEERKPSSEVKAK